MPDFLPVGLQDFLRRSKSGLREEELMIHQYKLNGYNIVLDVNSGSVHVVDDVAYDIIQLFCEEIEGGGRSERGGESKRSWAEVEEKRIIDLILKKYGDQPDVTEDEIGEVIGDIRRLASEKKLFSEDIYEPNAFDLKNRHTEIKALCLHVAHTCNLNCSYCFAAQGSFHGERALMSFETGEAGAGFPRRAVRQQTEPGGGLLRRRAPDELAGGEGSGKLCQEYRERKGEEFPLYSDYKRRGNRRRCHRFCQSGDAQCGAEPGRTKGSARQAAPNHKRSGQL